MAAPQGAETRRNSAQYSVNASIAVAYAGHQIKCALFQAQISVISRVAWQAGVNIVALSIRHR